MAIYTCSSMYMECLGTGHLLIGGTTGSGKSVCENGIIMALLMTRSSQQSKIILIDPKRVELIKYARCPHTLRYACEPTDIINTLFYAERLMMDRYTRMQRQGLTMSNECPVYIFIDELADLMTVPQIKKQVQNPLCRIAQLGRAARVNLIVCTQIVRRSVLPLQLVCNINSTICLRCRDALESRMIMGYSGAEMLPRYGSCYFSTPERTKPERWKVEYRSPEEINRELSEQFPVQQRKSIFNNITNYLKRR